MSNQSPLSMKVGQILSSVRIEMNPSKQSRSGLIEGITNGAKRNHSVKYQILWDKSDKIQSIKTNERI